MRLSLIVLICIALLTSAGCVRVVEDPIPVERKYELKEAPQPEPMYQNQQYVPPQQHTIENRFSEPDQEAASAVEKALMWSEKYEELSVKTEALREKNTQLQMENSNLRMQLSRAQVDLDQANKELADANAFLQEMQLELTEWKKDILGFRDEIRAAQAAQLTALSKILKVLGAEPINTGTVQK